MNFKFYSIYVTAGRVRILLQFTVHNLDSFSCPWFFSKGCSTRHSHKNSYGFYKYCNIYTISEHFVDFTLSNLFYFLSKLVCIPKVTCFLHLFSNFIMLFLSKRKQVIGILISLRNLLFIFHNLVPSTHSRTSNKKILHKIRGTPKNCSSLKYSTFTHLLQETCRYTMLHVHVILENDFPICQRCNESRSSGFTTRLLSWSKKKL